MISYFKFLMFVLLNTIPFSVGNLMQMFTDNEKEMDKNVSDNVISNNYNDLSNIPHDHFVSMKKLRKLYFSDCIARSPKVLTNGTFANLKNTQYVDDLYITYCGLTKLEKGVFDIFTTLTRLIIDHNNLKSFDFYVKFTGKENMAPTIDIRDNPLDHFPIEAIRSLKGVGKNPYIFAYGNNIRTISEEEFFEVMNNDVTVFLSPGVHMSCFMKIIPELLEKKESVPFISRLRSPAKVARKSTWYLKKQDFDHCNSTKNVNDQTLL